MSSATTCAPVRRPKRTNASTSACLAGWVVETLHQRAVELDQVGLHAHQLLEARITSAGVVRRNLHAALSGARRGRALSSPSSAASSCSVTSITRPGEVLRQDLLDLGVVGGAG